MNQRYMEKEWRRLEKAEEAFLKRNIAGNTPGWQEKAKRFVPEKLKDSLNIAFYKAFEMMFEKGTDIIEKTYQKEKKQQNYKINVYANEIRQNQRSLRKFGKDAGISKSMNLAVSAVEGVGMGLLGMGLPDIPVFLGVLLKSIYEIALSYGFSYEEEEEQIFILKLIETALLHENELSLSNMELNLWIREERKFEIAKSEQIRRSSDALAQELLYLKFVQGLPVVGVLGGISDVVYQKKISDFAELKYKKRFLIKVQG